jgi:hypothetical protein
MRENPFRQDNEEIRELVKQFQNLKAGRGNSFLEEEAFEKIILMTSRICRKRWRLLKWALNNIPIRRHY